VIQNLHTDELYRWRPLVQMKKKNITRDTPWLPPASFVHWWRGAWDGINCGRLGGGWGASRVAHESDTGGQHKSVFHFLVTHARVLFPKMRLFTRFPRHEALTWARSTNTRRDTSVCLVLYGLYYFERERIMRRRREDEGTCVLRLQHNVNTFPSSLDAWL
jgi:hypothetical protein